MFKYLDFLSGYKTILGAVATLLTVGLNAYYGTTLEEGEVLKALEEAAKQLESLVAICLFFYGFTMKIIKWFKSQKKT